MVVILPRLITCVRCQVDGVLERFLSKVMDMQQRHQSGHALWWMVLVLFCIGIVAYVCFFGVHTSKRQEPLTEADMDQLKPVSHHLRLLIPCKILALSPTPSKRLTSR